MAKPVGPTFTDYAVTAVSPLLIMAMVGSLVFFLVEVLYEGQYTERLLYTMFFFVIGTVLIARITIEHGSKLAMLYGGGLAAVTFLALQTFVSFPASTLQLFAPLINAGLMALIWWSANKLTWDCTHIDEERPTAGKGVLDAATQLNDTVSVEPVSKKDPPGLGGWIERWQRYRRKQEQRPHTPGVWVLYFALAALPIFGLGQSLIPVDDSARRQHAFRLMVVYVGCALGLLATTTLLGLRKYLRDRGAAIPMNMTASWLGLAAVITAAFLLVGTLLPRPHAETALINLPKWASSPERQASKYAPIKDRSTGEDEGATGTAQQQDASAQSTRDGSRGTGQRNESGAQPSGSQPGRGQAEHGRANLQASKQEGKTEPKNAADSGQKTSKGSQTQTDETASPQTSEEFSTQVAERVGSLYGPIAEMFKWLARMILAVLLLVAFAVLILRYLAPFTDWARNLLNWFTRLFRKRGRQGKRVETSSLEPEPPRPPPFCAFSNPFEDGRRRSLNELVSYSFQAFESWAWEHGLPRGTDETPLEFAHRVESATGFDGQPLVKLYGRMLYSGLALEDSSTKTVRKFWQTIPVTSPGRN